MADTKISALSAGTAIVGTEVIPGVQGGATVKFTFTQVWTLPSGTSLNWNSDTFIGRRAAAGFLIGAADAAAPVAQTVSFQGARGGTDSNTAAVSTIVQGSLGTGTGANGTIVFKVGTPQTTGTTQHVAATALTLKDAGSAGTAAPQAIFATGSATAPSIGFASDGRGWFFANGGMALVNNSGVVSASLSSAGIGWQVGSTGVFGWSSTTTSTSAADTGLARNAAGVVEVNNGTAGTYRDMWGRVFAATSDGTTSLCAFAKSTNVNTGMYFPGSNQVGFVANGTNSLTVTSSGATLATTAILLWASDVALSRNAAGVLEVNSGSAASYRDLKVRQHYVDQTITTPGTTGNQTINKAAGTVNIAAAGTAVTVTNSLVTTSSQVYPVIRTNDATARIANCVPAAGSFTINLTAAATAEISIGFLVIN